MGRIVIFTDNPGWHGKQLCDAFSRKGYQGKYVSLTACAINLDAKGLPLKIPSFESMLPDAVFVRGIPSGSLQEVVFYLDILHIFNALGIPVYNTGLAIERSVDKGMTSFLLKQAGIRTPFTWVLRERAEALAVVEQQLHAGYPLISKPLFGSQGKGVRRLEKMTDQFWLTSSNGVYYLQRFIECEGQGYSDIRVFVVNDRALAAMRRRGASWLNNVAHGATCEAITLNDDLATLAIQATVTLNMDYAGVDIIEAADGQLSVIEVNSIPAWKGIEGVCHINIAEILADDLINRYLTGNKSALSLD